MYKKCDILCNYVFWQVDPCSAIIIIGLMETFLQKELCCPGAIMQRRAPPTCYPLRRNPASIIKDFRFDLI